MRFTRLLPLAAALFALPACTDPGTDLSATSTFRVTVTAVNGGAPPPADQPLPANRGDVDETWDFEIEARSPYGEPVTFDGMVRLSVEPGTVVAIDGQGAKGRNVLVTGGKAQGQAQVTAVYGPARLWAEDLGYVPVPLSGGPACSNGQDDDGDVLIDFPADPGCAFADDDNEDAGSFAAGISQPVHYELPRIRDVQGGSQTPYPYEAVEINAALPKPLVVTRVSSDGFYVTDLNEPDQGANHLFAFNFSTPPGMRVCDRVTYLSGTISEFFGFTELSFPSYRLDYPREGEPCEVPEPPVLDGTLIANPQAMEKLESGLVRIEGYVVAKKFGPKPVVNNLPDADHSNCDLNGDGQVDFESAAEGSCSDACAKDPECTEWTSYSARGNYKVFHPSTLVQLQIQTGTAAGFDPTSWKGKTLTSVTGTLRNFSGGSLNWTIETRCPDDLVCDGNPACAAAAIPSSKACVRLRTVDDNDQGTN